MNFSLMARWRRCVLCGLFVCLVLVGGEGQARAMQAGGGEQGAEQPAAASVAGTVTDASGAVVAGAEVSITDETGKVERTIPSGADGGFTFERLRRGSYVVLVTAKNLAPYRSGSIAVDGQQSLTLPPIVMAVAANRTELNVLPTEVIAAQQIKEEEQQRIIGFFPNFYTSYRFDAAPLTAKQKYSLAIKGVFDPTRFVGSAVAAGIGQGLDSHGGYGLGAAGYFKRFAADYGDGLTGDILSHAVFPALLHQDPRYFYQGSGTRKSRLLHAISFAVLARNDSGHLMPNYSYLLGDIGSGAISNLYYPHADRGAGLIFTNAAIGIGGRAVGGILREFVVKSFVKKAPANGKP